MEMTGPSKGARGGRHSAASAACGRMPEAAHPSLDAPACELALRMATAYLRTAGHILMAPPGFGTQRTRARRQLRARQHRRLTQQVQQLQVAALQAPASQTGLHVDALHGPASQTGLQVAAPRGPVGQAGPSAGLYALKFRRNYIDLRADLDLLPDRHCAGSACLCICDRAEDDTSSAHCSDGRRNPLDTVYDCLDRLQRGKTRVKTSRLVRNAMGSGLSEHMIQKALREWHKLGVMTIEGQYVQLKPGCGGLSGRRGEGVT